MPWSTREVADLAGTTLRAVRYYHEIGLLDPPERGVNGYKHYGVAHLVSLLRIRRLLDLGMTLQDVRAISDLTNLPPDDLRRLHADLTARIERLERRREELERLMAHATPVDLPPALATVTVEHPMSEADQRLLVVLSRVLEPDQLESVAEMVRWLPVTGPSKDFDALAPDAPEDVRHDLAVRLAVESGAVREQFPTIREMDALGPSHPVRRAIASALAEIYNPAQREVLERVGALRGAAEPALP